MIHLRVSRRMLRWGGLILGVSLVLGACYALGDSLTPRDASGRPLILSPSIRAAEVYRRAVVRWVSEMEEVDQGLVTLLSHETVGDAAQLYSLSQQAQDLVQRAAEVGREATFASAPPALATLAEQAQTAVAAHLEAAQTAARWVGAPDSESHQAALEALRLARGLRLELEASRWLAALNGTAGDGR